MEDIKYKKIEIEPLPGCTVESCFNKAIELAEQHDCIVMFNFNGRLFEVYEQSYEELLQDFFAN